MDVEAKQNMLTHLNSAPLPLFLLCLPFNHTINIATHGCFFHPLHLTLLTSTLSNYRALMASQRPTRVLVIFVIFTILVATKCEARSLKEKKIDSGLLLRELGYNKLEVRSYRRDGANTGRVSPGGPDPAHHVSGPLAAP